MTQLSAIGQVLTPDDRAKIVRGLQACQRAEEMLGKCQNCGMDVSAQIAEVAYIRGALEAVREHFPEVR